MRISALLSCLLFPLAFAHAADPATSTKQMTMRDKPDGAESAVFWASDPIGPGETVLTIGEGFGENPVIEGVRLTDGPAGEPAGARRRLALQRTTPQSGPSDRAVAQVRGAGRLEARRICGANHWTKQSDRRAAERAASLVAQGNLGVDASPGGWIRLFGKNLGVTPKEMTTATARLAGPQTMTLPVAADCYAAKLTLPKELLPGLYKLRLHSGLGAPRPGASRYRCGSSYLDSGPRRSSTSRIAGRRATASRTTPMRYDRPWTRPGRTAVGRSTFRRDDTDLPGLSRFRV